MYKNKNLHFGKVINHIGECLSVILWQLREKKFPNEIQIFFQYIFNTNVNRIIKLNKLSILMIA